MKGWHAFDKDNPDKELQDHYFYLVTHSKYETPMKAMWHSENGGTWQVLGCWHLVDETGQRHQEEEFWYSWDANNPIIAWMEMPDIFQQEFRDDQLDRIDGVQWAAGEFLNYLAETNDVTWDMDDVWNIIYLGCQLLHKRGRKVRLPTHVTKKDGTEYITDWYEEDEDADMEH